MKTTLHGLMVLCLCILISCQKSDDDASTTDNLNSTMPVSSGTWYVTLFSEDATVETSRFYNYQFAFQPNGTITAVKGSTEIKGSWKKLNDSGKTKMVLTFPNVSPFDELNEDWEILIQNQDVIQLKHVSGGNGGTDLLTFGRLPVASPGNDVTISAPVGSWKVSSYVDKDRDRTSYYSGFGFVFNTNGTISVTTTSGTVTGNWSSIIDSGKNKMIFQFPVTARLDELNDDWEVISQTANKLELRNVSGGNGGISTLVFIK